MNWPIAIEGGITVFTLGLLVYYRLKRKFKDDRKRKMGGWEALWNFLGNNPVEIIMFGILIPDWKLILNIFK